MFLARKKNTNFSATAQKREIQIQMSLVGVKTDEWVSAVQIAGIGKL